MSVIDQNIIGIDATNIRRGGGVTHLVELINNANPKRHFFSKIVIWGPSNTLDKIIHKPWIHKINPPESEKNLVKRTLWQIFNLGKEIEKENCSILFIPGGSYAGNYFPVVLMSQNLLPFEMKELRRFGLSFMTLKLLILRKTQSFSFARSNGIIFLTKYAKRKVLGVLGNMKKENEIIFHGLNSRFSIPPRVQKDISEFNNDNPFKIIYVSTIDQYKHQWHVVTAVNSLRQKGYPIRLELIGPAYSPALKKLNEIANRFDPKRDWMKYYSEIPFEDLHKNYARADLGLFASSCENMPNILLETMASGLPIACSDKGPMPEMLQDSGIYFNPEEPEEIAQAIYKLLSSRSLRSNLSKQSHELSKQYSWERCADETFIFLNKVKTSFYKKEIL